MKKIIFRKFLTDCSIFFLISIVSASLIIWVFQAVNYLDIIIDDGRGYDVYLQYTLLNLPKIISRILPFAFFFTFTYIIAKYENNNQLLIFWNFGINKIKFINYLLLFSFLLLIIQIIITSLIVPKTQSIARSLIRVSSYNFLDNFIKIKKFNANVKELTIYTESIDADGDYNNIYIKKNTGLNNFQITYAKKGRLINRNGISLLELYDGENTNLFNDNLTNFSFSKSEFNLTSFAPDIILVKKTQEHLTQDLFKCILVLKNNIKDEVRLIKKKIRNCELSNIDNIFAEIYRRLIIPIYLPCLMLISSFLILNSKEKINYNKFRVTIFLLGFCLIVFSETTIRFINNSIFNNLLLAIIPVFITILLYFHMFLKFNLRSK